MSEKEDVVNITVPSSQADRKKIKDALHEISGHYQFIDDRKEAVKDIINGLHDDFNIPKKIIAKLAKTLYKHNYTDVSQESTIFECFYESIVESAQAQAAQQSSQPKTGD